MKDIKAVRADYRFHRMLALGENETQDFKYTVNDPRKIARSVSAFANNSGGHLLIGVTDNGQPRGVRTEEDIYVVEAAATMYCDPPCTPSFTAYRVEGGMVIKADIAAATRRPVSVLEADGTRRAYYRVADENIAAHPLMVRAWKAAGDASRSFTLTAEGAMLLQRLAAGSLTPEQAALAVPLSGAAFRNMTVSMASMGLVTFRFIDRQFHLALP